MFHFDKFLKTEACGCGQTVLPDMSVLIGQKLVENAKVEKFKWNIINAQFPISAPFRPQNLY